MDTQHDDAPDDARPEPAGPAFPRWLKWGLIGALAVVVLGYGAILLYTQVINDSPDELGQSDLEAVLAGGDATDDDATDDDATTDGATSDGATSDAVDSTTPADDPADGTTATTESGAATDGDEGNDEGDAPDVTDELADDDLDEALDEESPAESAPAADGAGAGNWVVTPESELGYRVTEVLFGVNTEGVGRTNEIEGALTIDGTQVTDAEFVVDVASIESDDGRRDGQFRGRIMSTDEFPTATFTLTEPIELGTESQDGATVDTTATGELTLRGVTNPVTFDVSAGQQEGRIAVLGSIPIVFADYEIANPSVPGISTEDEGLVEFLLVFEPAA